MIQHQSPISGIAAYRDRFVATAGYDNQLILWDARSRSPVGRGMHDHLANQAAFSPDGRYVVSSSSDHTARLWSVPDLKLIAVLAGHLDDVEMSIFHPTRRLIATASRDHRVRVYDFTGEEIACFVGHTADVISVAWSADGEQLISSSDDGTIRRWSMAGGDMVDKLDLGGIETDTIAIADDGRIFAGNDEGEVLVIDGSSVQHLDAHDAGVKRLVFNSSDRKLVSLSYDRSLIIWNVDTKPISPLSTSTLPSSVWPRSCAFRGDDELVFATFGSTYAIYDIANDEWQLDGVDGTGGVNAVIEHDGHTLTIGDAGVLRVDGQPSTELGSLCNFLTPVGSNVFTGGQMGFLADALTGSIVHQHRSPLNCGASFVRNGKNHLIVGTYTGEGLVFEVSDKTEPVLVATLALHSNAVKAVATSDSLLFSVCADTGVAWFSLDDLTEVDRMADAHGRIANGCAALPDGRFVSVSRDFKLRIWNGTSVTVIDTPHDRSIKCVATSSDGRLIATGSYVGVVAVYDCDNDDWITVTRPTMSGISSLHNVAGSQRFLAGSYDGGIYEIS